MDYYDDDKFYVNYYNDEECLEPICLLGEGFSEEALTDIILSAGLTLENRPKYTGDMEKLVFMYGEDSEVYSPAEIQFTGAGGLWYDKWGGLCQADVDSGDDA